ncbi:MAG: hypothetical protein MZV64_59505 [Ignavibacteriales bacterium]|nr:hypothetical protein [Ignavibacteriales bacterium]
MVWSDYPSTDSRHHQPGQRPRPRPSPARAAPSCGNVFSGGWSADRRLG